MGWAVFRDYLMHVHTKYISYDTVVICWLRQNSKEPFVKSICDT